MQQQSNKKHNTIHHPKFQSLTPYAHRSQVSVQNEMLNDKVFQPDKGGWVKNEDSDSDDNSKHKKPPYVRIEEGAIIPEPIDDREFKELALDTAEQARKEYLETEKEKKQELREGPEELYDIKKAFKLGQHAKGKKEDKRKAGDESDESSSESEADVTPSSVRQSKPAAQPKGKAGKGKAKQPAQKQSQVAGGQQLLEGESLVPAPFDINVIGPDYTCLVVGT